MREVLMVTARYRPQIGGTEQHVYEVSRRLVDRGIKVTVLTTLNEPHLRAELPATAVEEGVSILRVPSRPNGRDYYVSPKLYDCVRTGHWALVHCQGIHNLVPPTAMLASRRARTPYVATLHTGGSSTGLRRRLRGAQWRLLRGHLDHAELLIGVSQFELDEVRSRGRITPRRAEVIPNGADVAPPTPTDGAAAVVPDDRTIVSCGRLVRYKNHHKLIEALPEIQRLRPGSRLVIVGDGPYKRELQRIAGIHGVAADVSIRSIPAEDRTQMRATIGAAGVVVVLSDYESQGIVALEALGLGRPLVVAATSALTEYANKNLAAVVAPDASRDELARTVVGQLVAPAAVARFHLPTWDETVDRLVAAYDDIWTAV